MQISTESAETRQKESSRLRARRWLIASLFFLLLLNCQVGNTLVAAVSPTPQAATSTPFSPTPIPPTATPVSYLSYADQVSILNDLWAIVNQEYLYEDFNGVDWESALLNNYQRIQDGLSDAEFYEIMRKMIRSLGDDHSIFLSPIEVAAWDARFAGNNDYIGLGVLINPIPERDKAVVILTFRNSPAEAAGLRPRDSILLVDGLPILNEDGKISDAIQGPEGTFVTLWVQSPDEEPREVLVQRGHVTGSTPIFYSQLTTPQGQQIGYVLLPTFGDSTIDDQLELRLRAIMESGEIDGLIIDNRLNRGGFDSVLRNSLGFFLQGTHGLFVNRLQRTELAIENLDLNGTHYLPLVVLIGPNTVSYGEIFAGVLQNAGRAYLIGETTRGNVETMWGFNFIDGSRAWIAHDLFVPIPYPGFDWEETGIEPDLTVIANWEDYSNETDPVIRAALEHFDTK